LALGAFSLAIYNQFRKKPLAVAKDAYSCDGKLFPTIKLSNNREMPILGFGTWNLGQVSANHFDGTVIRQSIEHAIQVGYRHIDCAQDYLNEHLIGNALKELFDKKAITREELFITSKLNQPYHAAEHVEMALLKTLKDLQVDYLDLYLIHWPIAFEYVDYGENANFRGFANGKYEPWDTKISFNVSIRETWEAMEALVRKGYVRAIGVSNFNVQLLHDLLSYAKIPPVVNQVESHPYLAQNGLLKYCKSRNVAFQAYAPLGTPGTAEKQEDVTLLTNCTLEKIAFKHGKSSAQVSLKWNLMRSNNIAVITKSENPKRISENHSLLDFKLTDAEMEEINKLDRNYRFLRPEEWSVTKGIHLFE
jgi:diketogulonate reductase-like aldo/keto reductase